MSDPGAAARRVAAPVPSARSAGPAAPRAPGASGPGHWSTDSGPRITTSSYDPPRWLRNPHVQSVLGSSPLRRRVGQKALASMDATHHAHTVDGGEGIRLAGCHSVPAGDPRGLVLLLHGWEGSIDSSYMRLTAAALLARGFEVFRLNFRDHGETHHLNEALFHSNRLDEVVHATRDVIQRLAVPRGLPVAVAGYSLGGNFALRLGLRGPGAGIDLAHVCAVCPVLDPSRTMDAMEQGLPLYLWYFEKKWRGSLARKRELFPDSHAFDDATLRLRMRALTRWMVERHTDFDTLDHYFDGYTIDGDRLASIAVTTSILMAEDDPVIPVDAFRALTLPAHATVEISPWGGHCGFLQNARLEGYAEQWIARRIADAMPA